MNKETLTRLQEIAKQKGKTLLIESVSIRVRPDQIERFEAPKLIESTDGRKFKARGILRGVPVTRYTENLNERVYNKPLWERVHDKKWFEGALCLADHSEGAGSVKDISGVWRNFRPMQETANADLYAVGPNGALMLEVAAAGGALGFSTVGFGEFLEDGKTVNPDTYELSENAADWVIGPSQGVFGTMEHIQDSAGFSESDETHSSLQPMKENSTNATLKSSMENKEMSQATLEKLTESNYRNQARALIKEARESKNKSEAVKDLQEFVNQLPEMDSLKEVRNQITSEIEATTSSLQKELKEKESKLESTFAGSQKLQEKLSTTNKAYKELSERFKKTTGVIKRLQKDLNENKAGNAADLKKLIKERKRMKVDLKGMLTERLAVLNEILRFSESHHNLRGDLKEALKSKVGLLEDISTLLSEVAALKAKVKRLENWQAEGGDYEDPDTAANEPHSELTEDELTLGSGPSDHHVTDDEFADQYMEGEEDEDLEDENDEDELNESEDEDMDDENGDHDLDEDHAMDSEEEEGLVEPARPSYYEQKRKQEAAKAAAAKKKRIAEQQRKPAAKAPVNPSVRKFYEAEVRKHPALKDVAGKILASSSIVSAVQLVERFKQRQADKPVNLKEAMGAKTAPEWLGTRY